MAGFAVPVAGLLPATEWQVRFRAGRPGVDVDDPGLEVAHGPEGRVRIACEDRRAQAVARLVDGGRRGGVVLDGDDGQDGPKDLLLGDPVHRSHVAEDRGRKEVAVREVLTARALPAEDELALAPPDPDIRADLVDRGFIDQRPDVDLIVEP